MRRGPTRWLVLMMVAAAALALNPGRAAAGPTQLGSDELAVRGDPALFPGVALGFTTQVSGTVSYAGPTMTGQVVGAQLRITTNAPNVVILVYVGSGSAVCRGSASVITCPLPALSRSAAGTALFTTEVLAKTFGTMVITAAVLPPTADDTTNNTASWGLSVVDGAPWKNLIGFRPAADVQQDVLSRPEPLQCLDFQKVEDGYAGELSLDYYAVAIDRMPTLPGQRFPALPQALFSYVRQHLTAGTAANGWAGSLIDPQKAIFQPLSRRLATGYYIGNPARDDSWNTGAPLKSALSVDLGGGLDLAAIVTSQYATTSTSSSWTFSTLYGSCQVADVGFHPVSGNRQFGLDQVGTGSDVSHIFWTRGADQISNAGHWLVRGQVYAGGHATWLSLQQRLAAFVNSNGGLATIIGPTVTRVDWHSVCDRYWQPSVAWLDEPGRPVRDATKCGGGG